MNSKEILTSLEESQANLESLVLKMDEREPPATSRWVSASYANELEARIRDLRAALATAEEIAKAASLMIGDEHHEFAGCRFRGAKVVECFACLVQDKLSEIRIETLTRRREATHESKP